MKTNELHFIYDGWLLVQVRDSNNVPLVTYTRGLDLSGASPGQAESAACSPAPMEWLNVLPCGWSGKHHRADGRAAEHGCALICLAPLAIP